MMAKAFPLFSKTNFSIPERPQILGSSKNPLLEQSFYVKTNAL
jgi:hypothetical protein